MNVSSSESQADCPVEQQQQQPRRLQQQQQTWRSILGWMALISIMVATTCCHRSYQSAPSSEISNVVANEIHSSSLSSSSIQARPPSEIEQVSRVNQEEPPEKQAVEHDQTVHDGSASSSSSSGRRSLDTISINREESPGYKHSEWYFSDTYIRRAKKDRQNNNNFVKKWGRWSLEPSTTPRPNLEALYAKYPNRDVPRSAFPKDAWQVDADYLKQFLQQGIELTERALFAIMAEWGHYTPGQRVSLEAVMKDAEKTDPAYMFNLTVLPGGIGYPKKVIVGNGGYTSPTTLSRLRRQLLHAIMTEDSFIITMGGHSASAGHGNHFSQSYMLQTQQALEPIFARLGVFHVSRNIGMGGLGTIHNALAAKDIYGGDNDILWWDSSMTEGNMPPRDLFTRQGYLGGDKVPIVWGNTVWDCYDKWGEVGVGDSGFWSAGTAGVPHTSSWDQVKTIPYAARFVECDKEMYQDCRSNEYNGVCWIDREDFTPPTKQKAVMGGRAKWHPGNGIHLLKSRIMVYNIIKQLREALIEWSKAENYALPDEAWHVTANFNEIRSIVANVTETECLKLWLSNFPCYVALNGRSEFSPRAYPASTSIRSILRPDVKVAGPEPNAYDPPDVYNPAFYPPDGEVDYLAIVESGPDFNPLPARRKYMLKQLQQPSVRQAPKSSLPPGQGWNAMIAPAADNCDGSYESFCNRGANSDCLLYGHNDFRGILIGDALSGWLIMTLNDVKEGFIMILGGKYPAFWNAKTKGWKCENNAESCDKPLTDEETNQDVGTYTDCVDFTFEYAINGKVTTWTAEQFKAQQTEPSRLVLLSVLLDDRSFVPSGKSMDVELAIRVTGPCGRANTFQISHVYWA